MNLNEIKQKIDQCEEDIKTLYKNKAELEKQLKKPNIRHGDIFTTSIGVYLIRNKDGKYYITGESTDERQWDLKAMEKNFDVGRWTMVGNVFEDH